MFIDLVMWTKNGERFLSRVLKRIDKVIPQENVKRKILVDDHSVDRTAEIAKGFNWEVYENPGGGIALGANEALRHVVSPFFVSVEQDVLLAKDWWDKIPKYMENEKVAVAQGIRVSTNPTLRKLDEYVYSRTLTRKSIDNNIFSTRIVRQFGGFPTYCPVCVDTIFFKKITYETPYRWVIDRNVVSLHIQEDIKYLIQHTYKHVLMCTHTRYCSINPSLYMYVRMLATSPTWGLRIALRKHEPNIVWIYPYMRFMALKAILDKRRALRN